MKYFTLLAKNVWHYHWQDSPSELCTSIVSTNNTMMLDRVGQCIILQSWLLWVMISLYYIFMATSYGSVRPVRLARDILSRMVLIWLVLATLHQLPTIAIMMYHASLLAYLCIYACMNPFVLLVFLMISFIVAT